MQKTALILTLLALSLGGCGESLETSSKLNQQETNASSSGSYGDSSLYSSSTSSGLNSTATTPSNSGTLNGSTWPTGDMSASPSSQPNATPDPLAGTGISAALLDKKPHGWFSRCLDAKVQLVNHDAAEHDGYVIVTFLTLSGERELQYRYVSLMPSAKQDLTLTSTKPAEMATVEFRRKFL